MANNGGPPGFMAHLGFNPDTIEGLQAALANSNQLIDEYRTRIQTFDGLIADPNQSFLHRSQFIALRATTQAQLAAELASRAWIQTRLLILTPPN